MNNKGYVIGIYLSGYGHEPRGFWRDGVPNGIAGTLHLEDATVYETHGEVQMAMNRAHKAFKFFPCVIMPYEDALISVIKREIT